jgi:uncharacterized protein with FMN-binding domain
MAKIGHKMVALCAAAIGIIYSAGYVVTEPAALAQDSSPAAIASTQKTNVSATSKSTDSTPSSVAAQGQYRDGTYNGQGSNRIGTVEVAVTVNQGKIVSCEVTNCSTHYSVSAIDPVLPNEVVERQNGNVDVVTGATKSTQDFQTAVQEALDQAKV